MRLSFDTRFQRSPGSPAGGQPTSARRLGQPVGDGSYLLRSGSNGLRLVNALLARSLQHNLQKMHERPRRLSAAPLSPTAGRADIVKVGRADQRR